MVIGDLLTETDRLFQKRTAAMDDLFSSPGPVRLILFVMAMCQPKYKAASAFYAYPAEKKVRDPPLNSYK